MSKEEYLKIRTLKKEMETKIMETIRQFEDETGLYVIEINDVNTSLPKVSTKLY